MRRVGTAAMESCVVSLGAIEHWTKRGSIKVTRTITFEQTLPQLHSVASIAPTAALARFHGDYASRRSKVCPIPLRLPSVHLDLAKMHHTPTNAPIATRPLNALALGWRIPRAAWHRLSGRESDRGGTWKRWNPQLGVNPCLSMRLQGVGQSSSSKLVRPTL